MTAQSRPDFEITGKHVLFGMIAFFLLVIAVNAGFMTAAIRTFPGEDERRSYLQGLHYNDKLEARAAQALLGWRAEATIVESGGKPAVEVRFVDAKGKPVQGLEVSGNLRRPATTRDERVLAFHGTTDGRYEAPLEAIVGGSWTIHGVARRGTDAFEFERRLTWSQPQAR